MLILGLFLQAAALPMEHLSSILWGGLIALLSALVGLTQWFLRRMVEKNDASNTEVKASVAGLGEKVDRTAEGLRAIRQEIVGLDGSNGMKGKQRDMERRMNRDSVVLLKLAVHAGVDVPELEGD